MAMHEFDDADTPADDTQAPDLELRLLVLADTLLALTGLARIELQRTAVAAPRWVLLSLARVPLWILLWLSVSALLGYLAYAASGSMGVGLAALVLLQAGACLLLERGLRALWRRLCFCETRRALRECVDTTVVARAQFGGKGAHELH